MENRAGQNRNKQSITCPPANLISVPHTHTQRSKNKMCKAYTTTHLGCGHEATYTEPCAASTLRAMFSRFSHLTSSSAEKQRVAKARWPRGSGREDPMSSFTCSSVGIASAEQTFYIGNCDACVRRKRTQQAAPSQGLRRKLTRKHQHQHRREADSENTGQRRLHVSSSPSSRLPRRRSSAPSFHPLETIQRKITAACVSGRDWIGRLNHAASSSELSFCCIGLPDRGRPLDYRVDGEKKQRYEN